MVTQSGNKILLTRSSPFAADFQTYLLVQVLPLFFERFINLASLFGGCQLPGG